MKREKSLTERVIINLSPDDLKKLDDYCREHREDRSGFIRRTVMEKVDQK
jgi:metal-responsive CopG/Arc/MetJ family transcriptional regulator